MNYIHKLLKDREEIKGITEETLIENLRQEVTLFENFQTSKTEKSDSTVSTSINNTFSKIVIYYYEILSSNLKEISSKDASSLAKCSLFKFLKIYFYNMESVKYIDIFHDQLDIDQKSIFWILLVLYEKEFFDFMEKIYKNNSIRQFYLNESIVNKYKTDILEITRKLQNIPILIKLNIVEEYENYKIKRKYEIEQQDLDCYFQDNFNRRYSNIKPEGARHSNSNIQTNTQTNFSHMNSNVIYKRFQSNFLNPDDDEIHNFLDTNFINKIKAEENIMNFEENSKDYDQESSRNENVPNKEYYINRKFDMIIKDNHYKLNEKSFQVILDKNNVFNKNYEFKRRNNLERYTKQDVVSFNSKYIQVSNTLLFYLNHYYKKQEYYSFINKCPETYITVLYNIKQVEKQNYQCFICLKRFEEKKLPPYDKIFWCSYFMRYVCNDCSNDDYSVIPYFVLKKWDFSKYSISIKAKKLLEKYYTEPIIVFKANDRLINLSSSFKKSIYYKRKIHKIYDLMKCCKTEEFAINTLGKYKYLVLSENLFSLQDLSEIYQGDFVYKIKSFFDTFKNHILKDCSVCEYKGDSCSNCNSEEILYSFDIETVMFCKTCRNTYHKKCSLVHICMIDK